jgi:hypothetical protein
MTALTMGLGQDRANGHKDDELKKQMDDKTRGKEAPNGSQPDS